LKGVPLARVVSAKPDHQTHRPSRQPRPHTATYGDLAEHARAARDGHDLQVATGKHRDVAHEQIAHTTTLCSDRAPYGRAVGFLADPREHASDRLSIATGGSFEARHARPPVHMADPDESGAVAARRGTGSARE
jgi:hypothetical protein